MKLLKILGLTMVAATAIMAVTAGSALANTSTSLCKVSTNPCPAASIYPEGTVVEGTAKNPTLLGKFIGIEGSISCENSVVAGSITTPGGLGNPLKGKITTISFTGNCKDSTGGTCTVTTVKTGELDLLRTGNNEGTATSLGNEVKVVCSGGLISVNCVFGGEPQLHAVGTTTKAAELTATKAVLVAVSGSACPTEPRWDALYEIVKPSPVFINE